MFPKDNLATKPKLLLVEPEKSLLTTTASALNSKKFGIVGTATDAQGAINLFGRVRPDVLITEVALDHRRAEVDGVGLALHLRASSPMIGVVFLTSLTSKSLISAPTRLSETSYFLQKSKVTSLDVIETAIAESVRLIRSPESSSYDMFQLNGEPKEQVKLSFSDLDLLYLISSGLSNKAIAEDKKIALKSCENAIARVAKKLEVPFTSETNQRILLVNAYYKLMGKIS